MFGVTPWLQPGENRRHGRSNRFNGLDGSADTRSTGSDRSEQANRRAKAPRTTCESYDFGRPNQVPTLPYEQR